MLFLKKKKKKRGQLDSLHILILRLIVLAPKKPIKHPKRMWNAISNFFETPTPTPPPSTSLSPSPPPPSILSNLFSWVRQNHSSWIMTFFINVIDGVVTYYIGNAISPPERVEYQLSVLPIFIYRQFLECNSWLILHNNSTNFLYIDNRTWNFRAFQSTADNPDI